MVSLRCSGYRQCTDTGKNTSLLLLLLLLSAHLCGGVSAVQGDRWCMAPKEKCFIQISHHHHYHHHLLTFAVLTPRCSVYRWCTAPWQKYFIIITVICSPLRLCIAPREECFIHISITILLLSLSLLFTHLCGGVSVVQCVPVVHSPWAKNHIITIICSPLRWCLRGAGCTGGARLPARSCRGGS